MSENCTFLLIVHAKEFGIGLPRRAAKDFTLDFQFYDVFVVVFFGASSTVFFFSVINATSGSRRLNVFLPVVSSSS